MLKNTIIIQKIYKITLIFNNLCIFKIQKIYKIFFLYNFIIFKNKKLI